jgi:hypothetical protein
VISVARIIHKGNFNKTDRFLKAAVKSEYIHVLEKYGIEGVKALASATPLDSGETANSWGYEIKRYKGGASVTWTNSNVIDGVPIAIILQYGHGTGNGGYVEGRDYINPAIKPIFDKIASDAWKEVTKV